MANLELKTASGGSVTLVPQDGVSNVTATVKHESGVLANEAQVEEAKFLAGVGRNWQDVAASRSANVVYTNNTGRDIEIFITIVGSGATGNQAALNMSLAGVNSTVYSTPMITPPSIVTFQGFTIPAGAVYVLSNGGLTSINSISWWRELR